MVPPALALMEGLLGAGATLVMAVGVAALPAAGGGVETALVPGVIIGAAGGWLSLGAEQPSPLEQTRPRHTTGKARASRARFDSRTRNILTLRRHYSGQESDSFAAKS